MYRFGSLAWIMNKEDSESVAVVVDVVAYEFGGFDQECHLDQ